ncbi:MAG: hypothetical protein AB1679_10255 [Actinomycetota bacterium]|jgi:hypothetical protein
MDDKRRGTDSDEADREEAGLLEEIAERARGSGVGTEDPNIVGDAGPTDVPPGKDPDPEWPPPDTS